MLPVLAARHPSGVILDAWIAGRFELTFSTEILLEYEEVLPPRLGHGRWKEFGALLGLVSQRHGNVRHVNPSFRFHLIAADPDDDKFADCAIAAEADWIITNDHHFNVLIGSGYKPQPITPEEFVRRHLGGM